MNINRTELSALAGIPVTKFRSLVERGTLPFTDPADGLSEGAERRQRRFGLEHVLALAAVDELTTSGTFDARAACRLVENSLSDALARQKDGADNVWFGAAYASRLHGGNSTHLAGTFADIATRVPDGARVVLLSLDTVWQHVRRNGAAAGFELPDSLRDALRG